MFPFLAFSATGLLIGTILAFSSDQLSRIFIPLLFATFGGSIVAFGKDLDVGHRKEAYVGLFALSIFCFIGIIGGVIAVENRILTPTVVASGQRSIGKSQTAENTEKHYLRSMDVDFINSIDSQVRQSSLSKEKAYDKIVEHVNRVSP